jgi:cytoskeletal protein CcmA (bactofilin family)
MWNKRKEDEPVFKPAAAPPQPTPTAPVRESMPIAPVSTRTTPPEGARSAATIGKSVMIKGQIYAREDLYVDGEMEGTLELKEHRLTVGPNGKLTCSIKAREIVAYGTVQGNMDISDRAEIKKEARIVGDIKTQRIVIEDGAYFKGGIDLVRSEPAPVAQSRPAPPPQAAAASAPASQANGPRVASPTAKE